MAEYTLRTLNSKDLFVLIRLVKKIGIDQLKNIIETKNINALIKKNGKDAEKVGIEIFLDLSSIIIDRLDACENEIYDLLERVSDKDRKELEEMDMDVFISMVIELFQKDDFKKAFTKVVSLFK